MYVSTELTHIRGKESKELDPSLTSISITQRVLGFS